MRQKRVTVHGNEIGSSNAPVASCCGGYAIRRQCKTMPSDSPPSRRICYPTPKQDHATG
ncbi:hypothetical protein [Phocaeicola sp.]